MDRPQKQSPAKVLLGDALFANSKYSLNFVNSRVLKARLDSLESTNPGSKKSREQELLFMRELNEEIKKVNNVCAKVVLEIDESTRFLRRRLERVSSPEELNATESECNALLVEITQLEHYSTMSFDSFVSIMRKHDAIIGIVSAAWFDSRLQQEYFTNIPFQTFLLSTSNLFAKIRSLKIPHPQKVVESNLAVRNYFCREQDITKVQAWILKHVGPIQSQESTKPLEEDPFVDVTSVYLDGSNFQLYNNFLHSVEGARLVRVSWNGEDKNNCRLSLQAFTGITDTLSMKWKFIGPFLKGEWDFRQYAQKQLKKGKVDRETADAFIKSAELLISVVQEKQLRSILRVSLSRYEYGNEKVRLRLDGWSEMFKEVSDKTRWAREGQVTTPLKGREKTKMPVAVLKVFSHLGNLEWIDELVQVGLLHLVPPEGHPFDPFLFGVAKLYKNQLESTPSWLPTIDYLVHQHLESASALKSFDSHFESKSNSEYGSDSDTGDEDEILLTPQKAIKGDGLRRSLGIAKPDSMERKSSQGKIELPRKSSQGKLDANNKPALEPHRPAVRVEPKTFFSNERTLLQWINAIVALSTVAIALIGLGDTSSRVSGFILLPVAVVFGIYALVIFHYRLQAIQERTDSKAFQDHIGPYAIVIIFIFALLLSAFVPYWSSTAATQTSSYPMIPADTDYDSEFFVFTAPIPTALFNQTTTKRNETILGLMATLNTLGTDLLYASTGLGSSEQLWRSRLYTVNGAGEDQFFSIVKEIQESNQESNLVVRLSSGLPNWRKLQIPKITGSGRTRFVTEVGCDAAKIYHESIAYDAPLTITTLSDVQAKISYLSENLNLNSTRPLAPHPEIFKLGWRYDSVISHAISSTTISLNFPLTPTETSVPSSASLSISFQRKYATGTSFESARSLLSSFVTQIWASWPNQCQATK